MTNIDINLGHLHAILNSQCVIKKQNIHARSGDPDRVDQSPTCVPVAIHRSALFKLSHQVAFSAAWLAD